jgi:hypothetical protein
MIGRQSVWGARRIAWRALDTCPGVIGPDWVLQLDYVVEKASEPCPSHFRNRAP